MCLPAAEPRRSMGDSIFSIYFLMVNVNWHFIVPAASGLNVRSVSTGLTAARGKALVAIKVGSFADQLSRQLQYQPISRRSSYSTKPSLLGGVDSVYEVLIIF